MSKAADKFAKKAHFGQKRKYTGEHYIEHPRAVARLVKTVEHNKYMIEAALLHDVVEDCDVTIEEVREKFGHITAIFVGGLTDVSVPSDGNRRVRKELDRQHLAKGLPPIQTIKLADLINNSESILKYDPDFARVYMSEMKSLLEVLIYGDKTLHATATKIVKEYYA